MMIWKQVQQHRLLLIGCLIFSGCCAPRVAQYRPLAEGDLPDVIIPEVGSYSPKMTAEHLEDYRLIANSQLPPEDHLTFIYKLPFQEPTPTPIPTPTWHPQVEVRPTGGNLRDVELFSAIMVVCEIAGIDVSYDPKKRTLLFTEKTIPDT